ncbi:hypothetical protein B0T21DRAFT_357574 [Apiosordaria backusii]|uniref:Secreted protein n=1 Tax=Apiosordaria backusii TaxID=314023 RepID=A0AA40ERT2_9PEZI|nr:hypothetical protein B0T21DRAFT_357574 [Apiosordaria backusii]
MRKFWCLWRCICCCICCFIPRRFLDGIINDNANNNNSTQNPAPLRTPDKHKSLRHNPVKLLHRNLALYQLLYKPARRNPVPYMSLQHNLVNLKLLSCNPEPSLTS